MIWFSECQGKLYVAGSSRTRRDDLTIKADEEILLLRVLGYEQVEFAHPRDGAFVSTTDSICGSTAWPGLPVPLTPENVGVRMGAGRWSSPGS